ncbi:hypothetical protein [Enterobacter cloacae complex sp. 2025EL-00065]|uniref:hypothetical protein n=1 Tax=Enterobacter cloacae complex sp. 2025EL-00065 TaxID=3415634 RepID=UPI003C73EC74
MTPANENAVRAACRRCTEEIQQAMRKKPKPNCCDGSDRYPVYTLWEIKEALSAICINIAAAGKGEDS